MASFKRFAALVAALATSATLMVAGTAFAAFPNFSDCPTTVSGVNGCVNIQNTSGSLRIKEFTVPLGASLEIRGGLIVDNRGNSTFVPPRGTNGFFTRPVNVPGGLLGIDWIPGTSVQAITELAGDPDDIRIDGGAFGVSLPVKVRLVNLFIGMNCHIGTNANPVRLNLVTTRLGEFGFVPPDTITLTGNVNGESSFAVPGASSCGLGLGLINALVNLRLGLPSSSGNNAIEVVNNIALKEL